MRSIRNLDEDLLLFANRQRDMHDLWHTLTDYGRDELGEVCLLAFTCAQSPNRGIAFIALVGVYQMIKHYGWAVPKTVLSAYRDGKKMLNGFRRKIGKRCCDSQSVKYAPSSTSDHPIDTSTSDALL